LLSSGRYPAKGATQMKAPRVASSVLAVLATSGSLVHAQTVSITPDQLNWQQSPANPAETAVLMGDPRLPGPFVMRVRVPANTRVMPHSHPVDVQVTVLTGTLLHAEGETFDETKLKEYPAGSFFIERANVPHYAVAKTAVVLQGSGTGPFGFTYVNPRDDPRNK
jgi:quercetin dioxygenase-like cupin family protein